MKKIILFSVFISGIFIFGCSKNNSVPPYTPPVAKNFSVTSLKHTQDTVNVGDTIYLNVAGTVYDTTQNIYPYITAGSSNNTFTYGTSPSSLIASKTPVKLTRVIGASANGVYSWTSTIILVGATLVPDKSTLTISGAFTYQLTLSSEGNGVATITDAGQTTKTIYVR
jgi:hypothetical protein